jgi:DNA-binding CsgD family transcriptional regulator
MRLGDFIERSTAAADVGELVREFKSALSASGYDYVACGAIGGHDIYQSGLPAPAVVVDYPGFWQQHYFDENFIEIDPIVSRAAVTRLPYCWEQLRDLSSAQQRFFDESREAGLLHGVSVPLHGPAGEVFITSVSSAHAEVQPLRDVHTINLLVTQFHTAYLGLVEPASEVPVQLTARERECLLWSARGKSSWDIGVILNISERTVTYHLQNAMTKLDSTTRIMAIVKAIRTGLLSL